MQATLRRINQIVISNGVIVFTGCSVRYVQLRAFHYVATCGGFSRAAEELPLTQPAISDQVRKLEEEYDILLFNRMRKQVTLTSAGEALLQITRRLFDCE